jgi:hypothetical protein
MEVDLDDYAIPPHERERILSKLSIWAEGHPAPNQPFMALMGRTLTPRQFFAEVRNGDSDFGRGFLRFLMVQSERSNESPTATLDRAIAANQVTR